MKNVYFTCGPSQLYPSVKNYMKEAEEKNIASISHRSLQFQQIFIDTVSSLKKLLNISEDYHIFFLGSSLESMERIIENYAIKYSFHFINGSFSEKFYEMSKDLKKEPQKFAVSEGLGFNFESIRIPKKIELICFTQNETSTGVSINPSEITKLKKKYPDKLLAVDMVSSVPYPKFDFNKIDLAFFSVQKGFGLPAGLSVLIVGNKAIKKTQFMKDENYGIGSFHNFNSLSEKEKFNQTPETPNVLNIFLLGKVANDMNKYRIDRIRKETDFKAKLIYKYFEAHSLYKPFVAEKKWQSPTTIAINVLGKSKIITAKLKSKGLIVNTGYGKNKDSQIRIANFPAHSVHQVKKLLSAFDKMGL